MRDEEWARFVSAYYRRNELVAGHFSVLGIRAVAA